jgi:hypothetical protein
MYDAVNRHYYIDELARLENGNFIIPVRWLEDTEGNIFADAYAVAFNDQVRAFRLRLHLTHDIDGCCSLSPVLLMTM